MKKIILGALCLFLSFAMMAQETSDENEQTETTTQDEVKKERKHAIGISGGTGGFGADYSYKLNKSFTVTARFNKLSYTAEDVEQEIDGEDLLFDADLNFQSIDLVISYYPFKSGFRIIGGIGSFSNNELNIVAEFTESVNIGDVPFTTDEVGVISIGNKWKKTAPYLGIGFGRAIPKNKRLGFGLEMGTYFAGSPDVTLDATGIIEQTATQQPLVQESLSELKYLPYIMFRLSYSI